MQATSVVTKCSYVYKRDGSIFPYAYIEPIQKLDEHTTLIKIPLNQEQISTLRKYQPVQLIYKQDQLFIEIPEFKNNSEEQFPLLIENSKICPACGSVLFPNSTGMGRCLSMTCMAQIGRRIVSFLSNTNVEFKQPLTKILELLLFRGAIRKLDDLFYLPLIDLDVNYISLDETQLFLQTIHSIRGNIHIWQFINALDIPSWNTDTSLAIDKLFVEQNLTLKDISILFDMNFQRHCDYITWNSWNEVISLPENQALISSLGNILYR